MHLTQTALKNSSVNNPNGIYRQLCERFNVCFDGCQCFVRPKTSGQICLVIYRLCLITLLFIGTSVIAMAGGNKDNSRVRYLTDYSGNWEATDQYDLENPIELHIVIDDFIVPDEGYAELLFTLAPGQSASFPGGGD